MKKEGIFLLILLFAIPLTLANEYYTSSILLIELNISSDMEIVPKYSNYNIEYVAANLSFYPYENYRQKVLQLTASPQAKIKQNTAEFKWDRPTETELGFNINSNIKTYNKYKEVKNKVNFPIETIPEELIQFTLPSATIDSDKKEIIKLASELAKGEDDLFIVEFKLGEWVKTNIDYDFSTLTAEVSQNASWVLNSGFGVCDELTNLFIALNRALGIPAKFISGVAYTNSSDALTNWGLHGWAEVYFPDHGWIPFDVTYGELGYIDPSHIKLKEALDANSPSTQYQWLGSNVDLNTKKLKVDASLKENTGKNQEIYSINVIPIKDAVSFGSFNLIEVQIENLKDYYASTELLISKPKEVSIVNDENKIIYLKPKEKKSVFWPVKVSNKLNNNYVYTLPIKVITSSDNEYSTSFTSTSGSSSYSLEDINEIIDQKEEETQKIYSTNVDLNCSIDKEEFYEYEDTILSCSIRNIGNVFLESINVCLKENCSIIDLGISQKEEIEFDIFPEKVNKQDLIVTAINNEISKTSYTKVNILDEPSIEINNLTYPETITYKDEFPVSFVIKKASESIPYNIKIVLDHGGIKKEWEINQLTVDKRFIINLMGNNMDVDRNNYKISLTYSDKNGKTYNKEKEFSIDLVDISPIQRIEIFIKNIGKFFIKLTQE